MNIQKILNSVRDETGATAIEYGIIVALIGATIMGILTTIGTDFNALFTEISTYL